MDQAERTDDGSWTAWRKQFGEHVQSLVLRSAILIDERTGGGAKARPADRITHEAHHRLLELAIGPDLNRGAVGEKRIGDLRKVVHMRAEDNRTSVYRGLQNVVPAGRHETAPDEHRGGDLI